MKVSKKQLRKIIREERARLLRESVVDMSDFESTIQGAAPPITDMFIDKMFTLSSEDPDVLADLGIDMDTWTDAVNEAAVELDSAIANAISDTVMEMESRLVGGGFAGATSRRTGLPEGEY